MIPFNHNIFWLLAFKIFPILPFYAQEEHVVLFDQNFNFKKGSLKKNPMSVAPMSR